MSRRRGLLGGGRGLLCGGEVGESRRPGGTGGRGH